MSKLNILMPKTSIVLILLWYGVPLALACVCLVVSETPTYKNDNNILCFCPTN